MKANRRTRIMRWLLVALLGAALIFCYGCTVVKAIVEAVTGADLGEEATAVAVATDAAEWGLLQHATFWFTLLRGSLDGISLTKKAVRKRQARRSAVSAEA